MFGLFEALRIPNGWTFRGTPVFVWLDPQRLPDIHMVGILEAPRIRMFGLLEVSRYSYGCTFGEPRFSYGCTF